MVKSGLGMVVKVEDGGRATKPRQDHANVATENGRIPHPKQYPSQVP